MLIQGPAPINYRLSTNWYEYQLCSSLLVKERKAQDLSRTAHDDYF
jgi:hypothetical protein